MRSIYDLKLCQACGISNTGGGYESTRISRGFIAWGGVSAADAQMLDRGEQLSARIVKLAESKNPWDRIRFEVSIDG